MAGNPFKLENRLDDVTKNSEAEAVIDEAK